MIDIKYLNDYLPGIELIQNEENYFDKIPALWSDVLKSDNRKAKVISIWTQF